MKNFKNIKLINQTQISYFIKYSNLLITDFSSIVFDFIYQKKPFVLYIPDSNDPYIKELYIEPYYDIINGLKNNSIYFENKFFHLEKVIKKVIYYINHNFKIDENLKRFYNIFKFNENNNTNRLIDYITKID